MELTEEIKAKLGGLPARLKARLRGQDVAIDRVCERVQHGELGLAHVGRPRASFLFLGPTGVGKTELTLQFTAEVAGPGRVVRLGRRLGWSGVALKTCKTQTGALLSLCWAKAHGMPLMVQDLTNPMLAIIPHVRLAAHAGTIQGVECNAMQFYPDASVIEERVHPGLYRRRGGVVDLSTLKGNGFGYRIDEIGRNLPAAS